MGRLPRNYFNMVSMSGNYDIRSVGEYFTDDGTVYLSTARVTDRDWIYETYMRHPKCRDGKVIQSYASSGDAIAGHAKWLTHVQNGTVPDDLVDIFNQLMGWT